MNVVTSQSTRAILVRLSKGESLIESLATLAREHGVAAATVTGHGVLGALTVEGYDARAKSYSDRRAIAGPMVLTALTGRILLGPGDALVELHAGVARETDHGLQALGGRVLDAQAVAVEVTVFVHEDVWLHLQVDAATGLPSWRAETVNAPAAPAARPQTAPVPAAAPRTPVAPPSVPPPAREAPRDVPRAGAGGGRTLADVARELEAMPARPERVDESDEAVAEIQPGDLLDHPAWRFCEVLREPEPGTFDIRILDRGSIRTIKVEIFEVQPGPPREGKRVWQLKPRGR